MTKTYVIADLHGRYDLLELGMRTIVHDTSFFHSGDSIVTLGDYVDRGPQSRQIIEYLMAMQRDLGSRLICLKGNHEDLTRLRSAPRSPLVPAVLLIGVHFLLERAFDLPVFV